MAPMAHDGALMMPDGADSRTDGAGAMGEDTANCAYKSC
jgi:hypothetical protein